MATYPLLPVGMKQVKPAVADVRLNIQYGLDGTELTGILASGGIPLTYIQEIQAMRDISLNRILRTDFFMASSSDNKSAVTSASFINSGNIQASKAGAAFTDITSSCVVSETGLGYYHCVTSHTDTFGPLTIAFSNASAVPFFLMLNVVSADNSVLTSIIDSNYALLNNQITSLSTGVTSHFAEIDSNFNTISIDIAALSTGVTAGHIVVPFDTGTEDDPVEVYKKTNYNATFYVGQAFSSFATTPVYFTGKKRASDADSAALWSVQGTVSNATSMSAVFSLHPTSHTNAEASKSYFYEIQFRASSGDTIHNALVGQLRVLDTLKLGS